MRARSVWRVWVALLLAAGAVLLVRGVQLDTRLADLAPRTERAGAAQALAGRAERLAATTLRFVLRADGGGEEQLDAAVALLVEGLDVEPGVRRVRTEAREARLVELLAPHRFSLLPDALVPDVDADRDDAIVERAVAALYAPGMALRSLPIDADPLNLFGGWLDERLLAASVAAAPAGTDPPRRVGQRLIEARLDTDDERGAVARLERLRERILTAYPGVSVLRTGVPFFAAEAAERSRGDIDRISIGSLIGVVVLMLPVFRSFRPLVLPALSIAIGAASGAVLVLLVHGSMHVLTLVFGASLIGIVIDYSVHGFAHRAAGTRTGAGKAASGALPRPLMRALTLGLLTSAIGYAALGLSSVDELARVALFSVGGLFGAWLTVVALLPRHGDALRWHAGWVDPVVGVLVRVGEWTGRVAGVAPAAATGGPRASRGRALVLFAAVAVLLSIGLSRLHGDDDPRRLIDLSPVLIEQARAISVLSDDPDVARRVTITAATLDDVWTVLATLRGTLSDGAADGSQGSSGAAIGLIAIDDWLPSPARMRTDRQRSLRLLAPGGAVEQVLAALGEADPQPVLEALRTDLEADAAAPLRASTVLEDPQAGLPPLLQVGPGRVAALALVRHAEPDATSVARLREAIVGLDLPPGASVQLVDAVADTASALGAQRRSALVLLAGAVVAVGLLVGVVYRRTAALLLVAVPLGAILATLALLGALGIPLTLFHVMGLFLVLGLGMDYTLFLAELGHQARRTTLAAIVLSAATSLLSFGLLATSGIAVARFFAQTVFIGNAFSLVFSFVLLATTLPRTLRR